MHNSTCWYLPYASSTVRLHMCVLVTQKVNTVSWRQTLLYHKQYNVLITTPTFFSSKPKISLFQNKDEFRRAQHPPWPHAVVKYFPESCFFCGFESYQAGYHVTHRGHWLIVMRVWCVTHHWMSPMNLSACLTHSLSKTTWRMVAMASSWNS